MSWDIQERGSATQRLWTAVMAAGLIANLGLAGLHVGVDMRPQAVIRTADGRSDVVVLPPDEPAQGDEAEVWMEALALRMFSWDDSTLDADRAYVRGRVTNSVWAHDLPRLVPGFTDSEKSDVHGRIDVELRATRIIGEEIRPMGEDQESQQPPAEFLTDEERAERRRARLKNLAPPFKVEIQMAISFSGSYAPPGLGVRDPNDPGKELYGFLFNIEFRGRSRSNASGLVVTKVMPVQVRGVES